MVDLAFHFLHVLCNKFVGVLKNFGETKELVPQTPLEPILMPPLSCLFPFVRRQVIYLGFVMVMYCASATSRQ